MKRMKGMLAAVGVGAAIGVVGALTGILDPLLDAIDRLGFTLPTLLFYFAALYAALYVGIVLHEVGHMIMGLLTGYGFYTLSAAGFALQKTDEGLRVRRMHIPGTGGYCRMVPPEGDSPAFFWYYAGGILMNLLLGAAGLLLSHMLWERPYPGMALTVFGAVNLYMAVANGIPMRRTGNDGSYLWALCRRPEERKYFARDLKVDLHMTEGKRLKDMPEELFEPVPEEDLSLTFGGVCAQHCFARAVDSMDLTGAQALGEALLLHEERLIRRNVLAVKSDMLYCELVGENRPEAIERFDTQEVRALEKAVPYQAARAEYVRALLQRDCPDEARAAAERFEKLAPKYDYQPNMRNEREMMEYAQRVYNRRRDGEPGSAPEASAD